MAKTNIGNIERTDEEWRAWTREHLVCYEVRPLQKMQGTKIVQVGFEFEFAASLPAATEGQSQREAGRAVLTGLAGLARRVFPVEGEIARSELAPPQPVVQLRPGSRPELRRGVRIYYKDDPSRSVSEGDRQRLGRFEQLLKELGVKAGSWGKTR